MKLKPKTYHLQPSDGLTLIEMLVTLALISIFTGIVSIQLGSGNESLSLQRSLQTASQAIELAKNYSLGGRLHEGTVSAGGYGVRFSRQPNEALIFADCNGDKIYDASAAATTCFGGVGEFVQDIVFEQGIEIQGLSRPPPGCISGPNPKWFDVVFEPPNPSTAFVFEDDPSRVFSCDEAFIVIKNASGQQARLYINKLGVTRIQF